ncbi:glycosyltransferase family 39 protein [candidate division KSB1 bacterium]|nr:glycosyltransferase family 39 protein [candidate division KSB1 bacterium]
MAVGKIPSGRYKIKDIVLGWFAIGMAALIYSFFTFRGLDRFPPVHVDEPWYAAAAYKLAAQGIFGSDLFTGYYHIEQHNYHQMPLFQLSQALVYKMAGFGLAQMRLTGALWGLALLFLTFAVGRQIGGARCGALAVWLEVFLCVLADKTRSGIPLLEFARVARPDIAVPACGLAALWIFNIAEQRRKARLYAFAGVFTGMAGLAHLYGAFYLPALLLALFLRRRRKVFREPSLYLMLAGFVFIWLPWLFFAAQSFADYRGQMLGHAPRFNVFDLQFYLHNLQNEPWRFGPLGPRSLLSWRFGVWLALFGVFAGVIFFWKKRSTVLVGPLFPVVIALITLEALLALLIRAKFPIYLLSILPLATLLLSWTLLEGFAWEKLRPNFRFLLLGTVLVLLTFEGTARLLRREKLMAAMTPYPAFIGRLQPHIPTGALILGPNQFWPGLADHPYRTWFLPFMLSDAGYSAVPISFDSALVKISPRVILLDDAIRDYFASIAKPGHPQHERAAAFADYLRRRNANLAAEVNDATYGRIEIFQLANLP